MNAPYYVANTAPTLKVRNAQNRNQRRLSKRLSRIGSDVVTVTLPNGTLLAYRASDIVPWTVKRDAERSAKRTGGVFIDAR